MTLELPVYLVYREGGYGNGVLARKRTSHVHNSNHAKWYTGTKIPRLVPNAFTAEGFCNLFHVGAHVVTPPAHAYLVAGKGDFDSAIGHDVIVTEMGLPAIVSALSLRSDHDEQQLLEYWLAVEVPGRGAFAAARKRRGDQPARTEPI